MFLPPPPKKKENNNNKRQAPIKTKYKCKIKTKNTEKVELDNFM